MNELGPIRAWDLQGLTRLFYLLIVLTKCEQTRVKHKLRGSNGVTVYLTRALLWLLLVSCVPVLNKLL